MPTLSRRGYASLGLGLGLGLLAGCPTDRPVLPALKELLKNPDPILVEAACFALSSNASALAAEVGDTLRHKYHRASRSRQTPGPGDGAKCLWLPGLDRRHALAPVGRLPGDPLWRDDG